MQQGNAEALEEARKAGRRKSDREATGDVQENKWDEMRDRDCKTILLLRSFFKPPNLLLSLFLNKTHPPLSQNAVA